MTPERNGTLAALASIARPVTADDVAEHIRAERAFCNPDHVRRMLPDEDPDYLNLRDGGNVPYMRKSNRLWWAVAVFCAAVLVALMGSL